MEPPDSLLANATSQEFLLFAWTTAPEFDFSLEILSFTLTEAAVHTQSLGLAFDRLVPGALQIRFCPTLQAVNSIAFAGPRPLGNLSFTFAGPRGLEFTRWGWTFPWRSSVSLLPGAALRTHSLLLDRMISNSLAFAGFRDWVPRRTWASHTRNTTLRKNAVSLSLDRIQWAPVSGVHVRNFSDATW